MGELQLPIQVTLRNEAGRPKDQPLHPCKGRLLGRLQAVLEAQVAFGGEACLARALSPSWGPVPESHSRRQVGTEIWVLTAMSLQEVSTRWRQHFSLPASGSSDNQSFRESGVPGL